MVEIVFGLSFSSWDSPPLGENVSSTTLSGAQGWRRRQCRVGCPPTGGDQRLLFHCMPSMCFLACRARAMLACALCLSLTVRGIGRATLSKSV